MISWTRDNPLAEATLTLALAYLSYIVADRLLHVSGVVATLTAGMTVSALGRTRIDPRNWSYLAGVWTQVAFWAHSLVFLLASMVVPKLLVDLKVHDLVLIAALIVVGVRGAARGAVRAPAAAQPRQADEADQHRLQDRHRLGRACAAR